MDPNVTHIAAFVAGILSITSPCVLPLIPIYLAHLAGVGLDDRAAASRSRVVANAAAFVVGFSTVFVLAGVTIGAASGIFDEGRVWLVRLGGAMLLVMGLHLVGLIRIPWLDREYRMDVAPAASRLGRIASSTVVGAAFGAGWTPCVGPILGAILTMAAGEGSARSAAVLLAVYAAGLAIPFLAAALAFGTAPRAVRALSARMATINSLSGAVILALGAVLLLGIYEELFADLADLAPWRPWEPEL